jgi:hypothetical protein
MRAFDMQDSFFAPFFLFFFRRASFFLSLHATSRFSSLTLAWHNDDVDRGDVARSQFLLHHHQQAASTPYNLALLLVTHTQLIQRRRDSTSLLLLLLLVECVGLARRANHHHH